MAPRYKLRIRSLKFISAVDRPAQETARVLLIKRAGSDEVQVTADARVMKISEGADGSNPLVYCWAFTCTGPDGQPYHDGQGDAIQADFLAAAEEYLKQGAPVDAMHAEGDSGGGSRIAFAFPWDADIARAFFGDASGSAIKSSGLMVAVRPSPDVLAGFRDGRYAGLSIAGTGTRELVKSTDAPPLTRPSRSRRKHAVLTSVTDGHQHTLVPSDVVDDARSRLSTSYECPAGADDGGDGDHCHAWTYDPQSGAITVAMAAGHTHDVTARLPAELLSMAKSAVHAELAGKSAGRVPVASDPLAGTGLTAVTYEGPGPGAPLGKSQYVSGEVEKFIAELPSDAERVRVARLNPTAPWAADWIAKGIEMDKQAEIEKHATDFEKALAASEITFAKASTVMKSLYAARDRATEEHDAYIAKAAGDRKLHPGQVMNRLLDEGDTAYRALYTKYSEAHMKAADPSREIAAQRIQLLAGKIGEVNKEMRDQVEAFALQHNVETYQAQDRLLKISTSFRDLYEQVGILSMQKDAALTQAVGAAQQVNATSVAEAARAAETAKRAPERAVDKALREHVERFAKSAGIAYPVAMCRALEEDPTARSLYTLAQERQAS